MLDTVGIDHALYSHSPDYLTPSGLFCTIGMVEIGNSYLIHSSHCIFKSHPLGSTVWSASKRLLQLLSAVALPVYLGGVPRRHVFEPLKSVHSRFVAMAQLVEEGAFKAVIDSTYTFTNALDAYDRLMSRKVTGKVVIEVNDLDRVTQSSFFTIVSFKK
jgi:NADPH:quinone reductase-like Zn-dependent oxidoreductase